MANQKRGRDVNGIMLLDKPLGLSSNKALQTVKYIYQARKAGHTGSLDPLATGLLPIFLGEATKFSQYLLDADKVYEARVQLGQKSTTGDSEGEIVETRPVDFGFEVLVEILSQFLGEIEQVPSMFSAIKRDGQPLYKLARKGIEVERKVRKVQIFELRLKSEPKLFEQEQVIDIYVHCSKGTYIRNLAEDIGEKAGCGAHLLSLRRLKTGQFEDMHELQDLFDTRGEEKELSDSARDELDQRLLPVDAALSAFPAFVISQAEAEELKCGRVVASPDNPRALEGLLRLYVDNESQFMGLAEIGEDGALRGKRLLRTDGQ